VLLGWAFGNGLLQLRPVAATACCSYGLLQLRPVVATVCRRYGLL